MGDFGEERCEPVYGVKRKEFEELELEQEEEARWPEVEKPDMVGLLVCGFGELVTVGAFLR